MRLARRHVQPGLAVLDPFCGSGRLLLAGAGVRGVFVGIDVNPLACLITIAKAVSPDLSAVADLIGDIDRARVTVNAAPLVSRDERKVAWYSESVRTELGQIVKWINSLGLREAETTVVAAALSAAARDASYCRKGRWKLHRVGPRARAGHVTSAWDCLSQRLEFYIGEASRVARPTASVAVIQGDVNRILSVGLPQPLPTEFDVVITSPPYGDSRTTVQYGAASALCLDVVSHIDGFEDFFMPGRDIDNTCLGGRALRREPSDLDLDVKRYWAGARAGKQAGLVKDFLVDFARTLRSITRSLKPGGRAALVLGRRSVGGFRVKLDGFALDWSASVGLHLTGIERRRLRNKRLPSTINRFGHAQSRDLRARGATKTMVQESILTFEKPHARKGTTAPDSGRQQEGPCYSLLRQASTTSILRSA